MSSPRLSVLMTVLNGQRYIEAAVMSVLTQSFADFEFLVADDGSTDDTLGVLRRLAHSDKRLQVIANGRNLGITRSMNRLFGLARGDYITRHDSDDLSLPLRFERLIEYMDNHPHIGLLATEVEIIDEESQPLQMKMFASGHDNASIQDELTRGNCLCQGSVIFRRCLLDKVGLYDEALDYAEDYDMWLRMAEVTELAALPEKLYRYRRHNASVSFCHYGVQILHVAMALEKARHRRWVTAMPLPDVELMADTYTRAALMYWLAARPEEARDLLERARAYSPAYFDDPDALETLLLEIAHNYLPGDPVDFFESVLLRLFKSLPYGQLAGYRRLASRLHMRQVFLGFAAGNWDQVRRHLWKGLSYDPRWLLNRGVLSIAGRTVRASLHDLRIGQHTQA